MERENITARDLTDNLAITLMPITILLIAEIILGVIGNILIIIVYRKWYKTCNFRCFVLYMACIDLLSSVTTLPGEVFSQRNWYSYESNVVCKAKSFFNVFTVWASALILLLLAYDRHQKICHTLSRQLQHHVAQRLCLGGVVFSLLISSPVTVFWGTQPYLYSIGNATVPVSICEKSESYANENAPFIYIICCFVLPMTVVMLLTVTFNVCTGRKLLLGMSRYGTVKATVVCSMGQGNSVGNTEHFEKQLLDNNGNDSEIGSRRPRRRGSFPRSRNSLRREPFKDKYTSSCSVYVLKQDDTDSSDLQQGIAKRSNNLHCKLHSNIKGKKRISRSDAEIFVPLGSRRQMEIWRHRVLRHKLRTRRRKTVIMLTLSTVFIVTTTLYLILVCFVANTEGVLKHLSDSQKMVFFLFWRLYFLNSLINPVLYGCMDVRFRKGLTRLFCPKRNSYLTSSKLSLNEQTQK